MPFTGRIVDLTGSFAAIFVLTGLSPFIGLGALLWAWGDTSDESQTS